MKIESMKNRFLLIALFMLIITCATAQNSQVLYFMNLPQNHLLNPALHPTNSVYVGLPALTGVNFSIKNNFFNFSDVFSEGMQIDESSIPFLNPDFDRDKFLGRLKEMNYLEPTVAVQLFGLGFSVGKSRDLYIFLDVNEHAEANVVFPRDLIKLAFMGNQEFAGQTFDLSSTRADMSYYHEIGIGASKNITPKLRIGAKAKILFGVSAGSLNTNQINLKVNNDYTNTLDINGTFDFSAPIILYANADNDIDSVRFDNDRFDSDDGITKFLTNTKNAGFGFDLGAEYAINNKIVISAALTNIGSIKWKTDIGNLETHSTIKLSGLDFEDVYEGNTNIDDILKNVTDSISHALYTKGEPRPFTTNLTPGAVIGGKYILNDKISFGIISYSRFMSHQVREALTLSANLNLGSSLSTTLAYTACNNNYNNLGFGLAFRALWAQFYFLVDRIPLSWKKAGTGNDAITLPANWNTLHTGFGMNLVFGNKIKKNRSAEIIESE
jgi:hypothetical protein